MDQAFMNGLSEFPRPVPRIASPAKTKSGPVGLDWITLDRSGSLLPFSPLSLAQPPEVARIWEATEVYGRP